MSCLALPAQAQWTAEKPGSDNIEILGHIPLGPRLSVADLDMEQEISRPYAYVSRMVYGDEGPKGTDIISFEDPNNPKVIYASTWPPGWAWATPRWLRARSGRCRGCCWPGRSGAGAAAGRCWPGPRP